MSPVIRVCERRGMDHFIPHTGQHYSYNLDAGSGMHGEQTGKMLAGIEKVLLETFMAI